MAIALEVISGVIFIRFTGELTGDELIAMAGALARLESTFEVTPHRLADFSQITELQLNFETLNRYRAIREEALVKNPIKSALVAPSDLQFGFARMHQILGSNARIEVEVFREHHAAYRWLGLDPGQIPAAAPTAP